MYKFYKYIFILLLLTFFPCSVFAAEKVFYMSHKYEKEGIVSLKNSDKIDILAPQFYGISESLKLVGGLDAQLKKVISQKKIKVMPLIANAGFKQKVIHNLLLSQKAQNEAIKSMVDIAKKEKYVGWQFDFENISYLDKDLYSAFVEKTAKTLHDNNLILSVAVVARSVDYEDTDHFKNWSGVFDYARLAKAVDFISLMTYDDPKSVGPVASMPFIQDILTYVKDKIPPEKLSLGVPLYYWGWSVATSQKINSAGTYDRLCQLMSNFKCEVGFDAALSAPWMSYYFKDKQYKIWYQNDQSFKDRLNIVKQNNFRGFSAWVLGVEDPKIWSALANGG